MKKLVAFLCTVFCILGLTACGETSAELAKQAEQEQIDERSTMMIQEYLFQEMLGLVDYLSEEDLSVTVSCYDNDELEFMFNDDSNMFFVDGHGLKTAVESFRITKETAGALKTAADGSFLIGDVSVKISGNQILANADVQCEKKDANVELIFSNDIFLRLEGGSLNTKSTFGELMEKAALNTLIGMGTVFAVLILISLIIACFGLIPKIQGAFAKKEKEPEVPAAPAVVQTVPEIVEESDDTELVAVIAAAIAAYEGSTNTEGFVVRSIRRRF